MTLHLMDAEAELSGARQQSLTILIHRAAACTGAVFSGWREPAPTSVNQKSPRKTIQWY